MYRCRPPDGLTHTVHEHRGGDPVMFRDRHYESRPFCEVVISHTTPRGRSGEQVGEPPPPE